MQSNFKTYVTGISWFLLSLVSSAINDVIAKHASIGLGSMEVTFFRFLFSTLTLVPFILYYGINTIKTSHPFIQITRGVLLFGGMASWIYGLQLVPVSTATIVSFSIPLFVLVLAVFFLDEKIIWQRWAATIIGFTGIVITLCPDSGEFNYEVLIFVVASLAFASLDIINKKFIIKESMLSMLFYSALVTTILAFPLALQQWKEPETYQLMLLFILGCSANLILFFLLKAFSLVDATAVAPYRYFELAISGLIAYIVFNEMPDNNALYGVAVLVPTTLFIAWSETKKSNK
jgi:S-adenosylmethionine uptake transporter